MLRVLDCAVGNDCVSYANLEALCKRIQQLPCASNQQSPKQKALLLFQQHR